MTRKITILISALSQKTNINISNLFVNNYYYNRGKKCEVYVKSRVKIKPEEIKSY